MITNVLKFWSGGKTKRILIPKKVKRIQCERTATAALVSWTEPITHCESYGFEYVLEYATQLVDSGKTNSKLTTIRTSTSRYNITGLQLTSLVKLIVTAICMGCMRVGSDQKAACSPRECIQESASTYNAFQCALALNNLVRMFLLENVSISKNFEFKVSYLPFPTKTFNDSPSRNLHVGPNYQKYECKGLKRRIFVLLPGLFSYMYLIVCGNLGAIFAYSKAQ